MVWLIVGMLVLGAAAWWLLRRGGDSASSTPSRAAPSEKTHVRGPKIWGKKLLIPAGADACQAARGLEGKCFALAKVPSIPLAGCTHANCQCHYEPLPDRRNQLERRSGKDRRPTLRFEPGKSDRRDGLDRREGNRNPFSTEIDRQ